MSKIGSKPIRIPEGVTVTLTNGVFSVKGKLGEVSVPVLPSITAVVEGGEIKLTTKDEKSQTRSNWGTLGAHLKNAIEGVTNGFKKQLEIQGVGFRATMEAKTLVLNVGFSHQVRYESPAGITITVEKAIITVTGIDAQKVGQTAAEIRDIKRPEPYQGKGIRYVGEVVRRKQGKKVAGTTA